MAVPAPLELYRCDVEPDWVDYNRHMTEAAYLTAFGWATDALFRYIGDDEDYRAAGHSFYTVETHINYLREVAGDDSLRFHHPGGRPRRQAAPHLSRDVRRCDRGPGGRRPSRCCCI